MCVWESVRSLVGGGDERKEKGDGHPGPLLVEGSAKRRLPLSCVPTGHSLTAENLLGERTQLRTRTPVPHGDRRGKSSGRGSRIDSFPQERSSLGSWTATEGRRG